MLSRFSGKWAEAGLDISKGPLLNPVDSQRRTSWGSSSSIKPLSLTGSSGSPLCCVSGSETVAGVSACSWDVPVGVQFLKFAWNEFVQVRLRRWQLSQGDFWAVHFTRRRRHVKHPNTDRAPLVRFGRALADEQDVDISRICGICARRSAG